MFTHDASLFVDDEDGFAAYRREEVAEEAATEVVSGWRVWVRGTVAVLSGCSLCVRLRLRVAKRRKGGRLWGERRNENVRCATT